ALSIGDLIFGRLGLYGRLGASVRDQQGLAYYVYSGVEAGLGAGPWAVHAGVNPKGLDKAIEGILAEVKRLRSEPVTQDELDEAKDFVTGSLALRLETNDGVAATVGDIELFDLGLDYLERYPKIIRALTPEQILAVTQKYEHVEHYALVVAGPVDQ
ncbi:MAG: insulinase family protein, partial [Chloroflexi bacterium]|nr:insulinase family protein [Chloroflexota bacterium]